MLGKKYQYDGKSILKLNDLQKNIKQQIGTKINQEMHKFEKINCEICNSKKIIPLSYKDRYGLYLPVVICQKCGLIQTNPYMFQDSYNEIYKLEYRKLYLGKIKPEESFFTKRINHGRKILKFLKDHNYLKKDFKDLFIFEVGCASGGILQYFKTIGCQVQGIDLDSEYIKYDKNKFGLDLEVNTIKDVELKSSPDIVIYSHIFEHLLNIKKELKSLKEKISHQYLVYIEVPGVKNLGNTYNRNFLRYLQNAHTYHFTLTCLENILKINGFSLVFGDEEIKSIFKKSNQIVNSKMLKNDYKNSIKFLKKLEFLRIIYFVRKFFFLMLKKLKVKKKSYRSDIFHLIYEMNLFEKVKSNFKSKIK